MPVTNSQPSSANKSKTKGENIKVFIRIRPLSDKEVEKQIPDITLCDYEQNLLALKKPNGEQTKTFKFDRILGPKSDQGHIYKMIAMPIVDQVLQGYNGTIFAYGQTGTGKTFTMSGGNTSETKGIIPNCFSHIFTHIAQASEQKIFTVTVTYLEIYNEEIRDLLSKDPTKKLALREHKTLGVFVKDLSGFTVNSVERITDLLKIGNKNRMTRATMMNDVSSRSHTIFQIAIDTKDKLTEETTCGKLNLVDLAGSERASRTQATGDRLKEAGAINLSLSALGKAINCLAEGGTTKFRDSKLTRLLSSSLGGNSKTAMIAMVSPAENDYEESICTLRYAQRAKYIRNHASINVNVDSGIMAGFQKEMATLRQEINDMNERIARMAAKRERSERAQELEQELHRIEEEKKAWMDKIAQIEDKIMIGGENLIDKKQQQDFLIMTAGSELQELDVSHQELEKKIKQCEQEKINIEEKYSSLNEEDNALTKKIKRLQQQIKESKEEYADKEQEYQREIEALNENNGLLTREMKLASFILDGFIPAEYRVKIAQNLIFNSETLEYQIRGVAYTGNNMRKPTACADDAEKEIQWGNNNPYHMYPKKKADRVLKDPSFYLNSLKHLG